MTEHEATRPEASSPSTQPWFDPYGSLVGEVRDRALFLIDPGGFVTTWNAGGETVYGYTPEEIIGQHFSRFYTREVVASGDLDELLRVLPENGRCEADEIQIRRSGERFTGCVAISPLREPSGEHIGFAVSVGERAKETLIGATVDIAERRRRERALAEGEERLHRIFENVPEAVVLLDRDLRVRYANEAAGAITGLSPSETIARGSEEIWPQDVREPHERCLREAIENGAVRSAAVDLAITRGGPQNLLITCVPVLGEGGKVHEVVCITQDLTEGKRAAAAIAESRLRENRSETLLRTRARLSEMAPRAGIDELMRIALDAAGTVTGSRTSSYCRVDADQRHLWLHALSAAPGMDGADATPTDSRISVGDPGIWGDCLREASPIARKGPAEDGRPVTREVAVPIRSGGHVVAMLGVSDKQSEYTRDDIEVLQELASMMGDVVARKQAEEALLRSEDRHRRLEENISDVIWAVDIETGRFSMVSPSVERLTGFTVEQALSQDIEDMLAPASFEYLSGVLPGYIEEFRKGLGTPHTERLELRCRNGSTVWVELNSRLVLNEGTGHIEAYGISRDITERRRAEEAQRQRIELQDRLAEEALRRRVLMEKSRDGIVVLDEEGGICEANSRFAEMLGYASEEVCRLHVWDWDDRWTRPELLEMLRRVDSGGMHIETRHRRKDGTYSDVEISSNATVWGGKKLVLCICRDVSQRRQTERRLLAQSAVNGVLAESESLRDAAPKIIRAICESERWDFGAIWRIDEEAKVLRCVDLWHRDDLPAEELVAATRALSCPRGSGLSGLVWASGAPMLIPSLADDPRFLRTDVASRTGLRSALGFPILHGAKVVGVVDFLGTDIREPDQTLLDVLGGIGSQIGQFLERKDAEEELRRLASSSLDTGEQVRLEEQLRQSQAMEAIGRIAGGLAHDFNNLLTVMHGNCELLLTMLPPGDPRRLYLGDIRDAVEKATAVTRQLLALGRKQVLEPKILDVNHIVSGAERMLRRLIGDDIALATILSPSAGFVEVDPTQIGQVLIDLALGARDAMPGGGRLTIETSAVELDEEYCRSHPDARPGWFTMITVTDTGRGAPPESRGGAGPGLAAAFGIVKQSEGHIEVHSEVGVGTSLRIYLPSVETAGSAPRAHRHLGSVKPGRETILLVEEEDAVRRISRLALEAHGYTVIEAGNGMEAIAIAQEGGRAIGLLLTDVAMPEIGGRRLPEVLKGRLPDLKVIYTSGSTDDSALRHGIIEANATLLEKPFSPWALANKVREVLDKPD